MPSVKVTLFRLSGCGPCSQFSGTDGKSGEWSKFEKSKNQIQSDNVQIKSIEASEQSSSKFDKPYIGNNEINSYPTVKITIDGVEEEYKGDRLAEKMIEFINHRIKEKHNQEGGKNDTLRYKALKYKRKYQILKQMLN